jgi:hypothetical protein
MQTGNENKVFLRIHEFDCLIEDITSELGIEPTKSWIKGDLIPDREGEIRRKQSTWEYQSQLSQSEYIERHVESLLELVESKKESLQKFSKIYQTELAIVIYEYESPNVGFSLDKEIVQRISDMGLILDVDIYVLIEKE